MAQGALIALLLAALLGCSPGRGGELPRPLPLRILCFVKDWVERGDFRIRDAGTDLCAPHVEPERPPQSQTPAPSPARPSPTAESS